MVLILGIIILCVGGYVIYKDAINRMLCIWKNRNNDYLLITKRDWSGWSMLQPNEETICLKVESSNIAKRLEGLISEEFYDLNITRIDQDKLSLMVDGLYLKQGENLNKTGTNLRGCKLNLFTINKDEKVKLSTCSFDMGTTWEIVYK